MLNFLNYIDRPSTVRNYKDALIAFSYKTSGCLSVVDEWSDAEDTEIAVNLYNCLEETEFILKNLLAAPYSFKNDSLAYHYMRVFVTVYNKADTIKREKAFAIKQAKKPAQDKKDKRNLIIWTVVTWSVIFAAMLAANASPVSQAQEQVNHAVTVR
jgi:hypothetical protein